MARVVVLGGLNMDLMVETARPAGPGETRAGERFYTAPGGKGGNQAVAAARILGTRGEVCLVARAGRDGFGDELVTYLEACGVDTAYVRRDPGAASGVAVILIDASGENYVNAVYGANARCDARQAADAIDALGDGGLLLVQQEIPLEVSLEAMRAARSGGSTVILDPAPTRSDDPAALLAEADVITPNEHEASDLCGFAIDGPDAARSAARHLRSRGARSVIVTLAERGVWVESDDTSTQIEAPTVRAVATVGAGDAFNGGLAAGLAEGLGLAAAARVGVAAGALCVTKPGAQEAMPGREEVDALLAEAW